MCIGTTSWVCPFSRRPTFRATASASTAAIRDSKRRCGASRTSRRFRWTFRTCGRTSSSCTWSPARAYDIAGMTVTAKRQCHPGDSYGYRFESNGRSVVYSTDSEHKLTDPAETEAFADFFRSADLVIFDAMYSLAEATTIKADWGHSSNVLGVELCQRAGARQLCLFHHDPANDDETIASSSPTRSASRKSPAPASPSSSPPPTTGWKSRCEPGRGSGGRRAPVGPCSPGGRSRSRCPDRADLALPAVDGAPPGGGVRCVSGTLAAAGRLDAGHDRRDRPEEPRRLGQWPWPRSLLAQLIDDINRQKPAAIGLDIVMPEPDAHSAERVLARAGKLDPALARQLAALPSNDTTLAASLSAAPTVLAVTGSAEPTGMPLRAPLFGIRDSAAAARSEHARCVADRAIRRRGDQHRRDRSGGGRPRPHFGRAGGRDHPPHSARRECRRDARAGAGGRDDPGRAGRPAAAAARVGGPGRRHRGRRVFRAHRGRRRRPRLLLAAQHRSLRLRDRHPGGPLRSGAPAAEAGADRRHRGRDPRGQEHAAGRPHAGGRDPRAAHGKPVRRDAAHPPVMGAAARGAGVPAAGRAARRRDAAVEAAVRGDAGDRRHRRAAGVRIPRLSQSGGCCSTRQRPRSALACCSACCCC